MRHFHHFTVKENTKAQFPPWVSVSPLFPLGLHLMMWTLTLFHLSSGYWHPVRLGKPKHSPAPMCLSTLPQTFPWPQPMPWLHQSLGSYGDCRTHVSNIYQRTLITQVYYSCMLEGTRDAQKPFWEVSEGERGSRGRQRERERAAEGSGFLKDHG